MEQNWFSQLWKMICPVDFAVTKLFRPGTTNRLGVQKCKSGGESLIVNDDRISELPEHLLLLILASLPTENLIATSVLSKRWTSLWKMLPNLKFDSNYHDHHTFLENVYKTLILHKAPSLESLHLIIRDRTEHSDFGIVIGIAFAHHVRKLVVELKYEQVLFPKVACSFNNTLEILILKNRILLSFPSRVCLKSLRELHLDYVEFRDEESVCNLLCGCPSLQDLFVRRNSNTDVETFAIEVPTLQRLTIEDNFPGRGDGGYVINAPSLSYLNINGFRDHQFCLIENSTELVEAKIINVSNITNENILASLTSAKRLTLDIPPLKSNYHTSNIFHHLVSLELHTDRRMWCNLLSPMLDSSPQLQMLKLIDRWSERRLWDRQAWEQPKCVPQCLLFHLETFVWTRYEWQREDEKEVATYILKNARRLKKATLSTKPIHTLELEKLEKRREMVLNELASVVRASNSCDLAFESLPFNS